MPSRPPTQSLRTSPAPPDRRPTSPAPVFATAKMENDSGEVIYSSRQIYGDRAEARARDGRALQRPGRRDPIAHSGTAARRRSVRLRYPREPEDSPVEGVASSGVPPA